MLQFEQQTTTVRDLAERIERLEILINPGDPDVGQLAIKTAEGLLTATADHLAGEPDRNAHWILEVLGGLPLPPPRTEAERSLRKAYQLFQIWMRILRRHDERKLPARRTAPRTAGPHALATPTLRLARYLDLGTAQ